MQSPETQDFILRFNQLLKEGVIEGRPDVIAAIGIDKATLSQVMRGKLDIPANRYNKFLRVYFSDKSLENTNNAKPKGTLESMQDEINDLKTQVSFLLKEKDSMKDGFMRLSEALHALQIAQMNNRNTGT